MELILEYLGCAMDKKASDVFIVSGMPVSFKIDGEIVPENEEKVMPERANELVSALYTLAGRSMERFLQTGDDDFSVSVKNLARFHVSAYRQRGSLAAVSRPRWLVSPMPSTVRAARISLRLKIRLSICIVMSRVSSASVSLRPIPTAM